MSNKSTQEKLYDLGKITACFENISEHIEIIRDVLKETHKLTYEKTIDEIKGEVDISYSLSIKFINMIRDELLATAQHLANKNERP